MHVRAADLMLMAEEAPSPALRARAHREAAAALRALGQHALAREQIERALAADPGDADDGRGREEALAEAPAPQAGPARVLLFSGHMIDHAERATPRFPPEQEPVAARAIGRVLAGLDAGPGDLALCGAACGGDILFAEACRERRVPIELHLPFEQERFLAESVAFPKRAQVAERGWVERYREVLRWAGASRFVATRVLGDPPPGRSAHARNNLWLLYSALCLGAERVHLVALWNGRTGDGPGGTQHMCDEVLRRSGRVHLLDTRRLWQI